MNYELELNERQFEAVSANDQYLRIIAGAGSGKTRVLTYRIAYLIEVLKVYPNQILAITFTNKVAKEMNERAKKLLPNIDLTGLIISTFHSFCARFLRNEIHLLGFPKNFVIFDDDDKLRMIKAIGEDFGFKKTDDNNKLALNFISKYKTIGQLPSEIPQFVKKQHEILYNYFVEYEKRKAESKALDFDDLLIYTVKILESYENVKTKWSNRFSHILVDEFQDTNDLQFKLLTLLTNGLNSVYVVGDPDQTIYTWRGANQRIILNFDSIFVPTRSIVLEENYRSTTKILDSANNLISFNKERLKKNLFTKNGSGDDIIVKNLDSSTSEANFIARSIEEIRSKDPSAQYKDFTILYRSSYLSLKIEQSLTSRHIPYKVYGGLKFYSRKEIKDCLAYFRLIVNSKDNISFERIINVPKRGVGDKNLQLLRDESKNANLSEFEYLAEIDIHDTEIKPLILKRLTDMVDKIIETREKIDANLEAYSEVLDTFLKDIGYYEFLEDNEDEDDKILNVQELISDIRNYLKENPDSTFDEYLQNIQLITSQDEIGDQDFVSLMTVHTAKGLEFKYVFIIGFIEGVFPNQRALLEGENGVGIEEERRLAYVAFTRAKKQLYITMNREYSFALQSQNMPSRFLKEAKLDLNNKPLFESKRIQNVNTYSYDFRRDHEGTGLGSTKRRESQPFNMSAGNGIVWKVNDICQHTVFGEGVVKKVEDDIITVDFIDFGVKKMLGSHKTLSKKGGPTWNS